ncbi:unnamed protein product [Durusdinium trenchii]|uniref:Uncharacterized protein n=1 Tax=Durusdinium trenchii TaxID=1381693 RepID=A0ABP0HJX1_9DINO
MPAMINYWHVQPSARWGQEDLYGNIGDDDAARVEVAAGAAVLRTGAKKQKTGSSYASAMTAMLKGDFDEDESRRGRGDVDGEMKGARLPSPKNGEQVVSGILMPEFHKLSPDLRCFGCFGSSGPGGCAVFRELSMLQTLDFNLSLRHRPCGLHISETHLVTKPMMFRLLFSFLLMAELRAEEEALALIQGHARKIVKSKAAKSAAAPLDDALLDMEGLSLMQGAGAQCRVNAPEKCTARVRRAKPEMSTDPVLSAAVADGVEDSMAAISLFQTGRGSFRKADECGSSGRAAASEASIDEGADSAATSLLQQERSKIKVRKVSIP